MKRLLIAILAMLMAVGANAQSTGDLLPGATRPCSWCKGKGVVKCEYCNNGVVCSPFGASRCIICMGTGARQCLACMGHKVEIWNGEVWLSICVYNSYVRQSLEMMPDPGSSSSTSSSSTSSSSSSSPSTSWRNAGDWYTCPCVSIPTYGYASYHRCTNCGETHQIGTSHSCKKR